MSSTSLLLSSLVHSAPLLSPSHSLDDLPPLPDTTASTVSSSPTPSPSSLALHSTPLSMMEMDQETTVPSSGAAGDHLDETQHTIASDAEEIYVEAPETLLRDTEMEVDNAAMYEGEETENRKMNHLGGLGEVNTAAFQTPDRKRTFEVDSKTITRPKKASPPSVSLPEVFNGEDGQPVVSPSPIPVSPNAMSAATTTSSSLASTRPIATSTPLAAAAAAPPPSAAAAAASVSPAGLADTAKRPTEARVAQPRAARQQTMVVSSATSKDVKALFEEAKAAGSLNEEAAARMEKRVLSIVQEKDSEWHAKYDKLGQIMLAQKNESDRKARQAEADMEAVAAALATANQSMQGMFGCGPSSSSSLPSLPPAPVIAAMSADKMAELARVKKENESLESENNKLHSQYNSLFETYSQQRSVIPTLKNHNEELERAVKVERERFEKLKRHAEAKLEEASGENDNLRKELVRAEKNHDLDTQTIRMKLKMRDSEVEELQENLTQKKRQVADLKEICNELIRKTDGNASDLE